MLELGIALVALLIALIAFYAWGWYDAKQQCLRELALMRQMYEEGTFAREGG